MKVAETIAAERAEGVQRIAIPCGLLGFEHLKEYDLVARAQDEPFVWLQVAGTPDIAFLCLSPFLVAPNYQPDVSSEDAAALGLHEADDAVLLNIVTLRGNQSATINLKGPIVINRHTRVAKQVILNNASDYSVQHPIALA